jgi:hypothetical protein
MSYFENDLIKRMIKQLAVFVARIARARSENQFPLAREVLGEASQTLLGLDWEALAAVDVASAALLLRDPGKLRIYADLLETEAENLEAQGDGARAQARRERAAALRARAG